MGRQRRVLTTPEKALALDMHRRLFGVAAIAREFRKRGHPIGPHQLGRLLREMGQEVRQRGGVKGRRIPSRQKVTDDQIRAKYRQYIMSPTLTTRGAAAELGISKSALLERWVSLGVVRKPAKRNAWTPPDTVEFSSEGDVALRSSTLADVEAERERRRRVLMADGLPQDMIDRVLREKFRGIAA